MLNEPGRLLGHELAAQMDRVISRMVEKSSLPPNPPRATLRRTFRDTRLHSKGCDYFSTGVPRAVGVLITDRKEVVSQNAEPFTESDVHISQSSVQTDFDQLFLADRITVLEESTDSNESEDSFSDTDSSTMSEKDIEDLLSPARLYFLQKQKALELRAKGWSMVGVFQHLVACSDETILEFCQRLWKLCFIFEKAHVLEEALMGFELIQAGYDIEFGAASKETMRCFVYKARILRKMKRYQDSEALYRQAIAGFRSLRQRVAELKCQLLLGTFLQSLERHSEALQFLLEALTEHFAQTKTIEESRKVIDLLDSIRKLHSKMRLGPDLIKSISRLKSLQHEWIDTPNHLNLLSEFVQLGGHYSKLHKYEMADLCFAYPAPIQSSRISPAIRIEALKYSRELSIHYQRQGKWIKSIEHLEHALEQLPALLHLKSAERTDFQRPLVVTDTLEHDLFATLGRLLSETRPTGQQPVVRDSCKHWSTWKRAEAAWAKLDTRRRIIRHKPIRHSRIDSLRDREIVQRSDSTSLSSQGSSGISSGSAGSRLGLTYSVGSASSIVSNSVFMVP
jgi:tetratricopeptide (TPR) repeat protein